MAFQFDADIDPKLVATLTAAEGSRQFVYPDSLGFLTVGIGRNVDYRSGKGLSEDERNYLLQNDIRGARQELKLRYPWAVALDYVRWAAMNEIMFVLGYETLSKFNEFLCCMVQKDYGAAAHQLVLSEWHHQAPLRVQGLAQRIATGKD